jgi:Flp pilus assembly protein TadD
MLRGRAFLLADRLTDAESAFRAALAANPGNGSLHYQLGRVLKREGKTDEAEREFAATKGLIGTQSVAPQR